MQAYPKLFVLYLSCIQKVSVGQLSMEVGYVVFTETPKSASLASIILGVAIVIVVVGIIVIVVIMWRKKIGPFKKKVNKEFHAAYMSGRAVNTSPGGEHMYDMMDNQRNGNDYNTCSKYIFDLLLISLSRSNILTCQVLMVGKFHQPPSIRRDNYKTP